MDNKSLGELIRKKRKEKQMTQSQLADLLYVSTNAISKWELGKNAIDRQNLERLSDVLDIPRALIFDEPQEVPTPAAPLTNTGTTDLSPPSSGNDNSVSPEPVILPVTIIGRTDTGTTDLSPPFSGNDDSVSPEPVIIPVTITEKKAGRKMLPFMLLGIGCILIVATFIVSMRLSNRNSFSVQDEFFDEYEGEAACYLIVKYSGELTVETLNEYLDIISKSYADHLKESAVIILFYENYSEIDILSQDTADAVSVILPDSL